MTQYGFFIDLSRCIGCNACTIACKEWHNIDPGPAKWMRIYQWEKGAFPDIEKSLQLPRRGHFFRDYDRKKFSNLNI